MADPTGGADRGALRLDFDRRLMLQFHISVITSDGGLLRQSVFGRLAGYGDVNDADRLCRDPAMRWVVGGAAPMGPAVSASQMGRFETEWLVRPENLAALAALPGQWIDGCSTGDRRR
jgi:Transposase DDE domain group 1